MGRDTKRHASRARRSGAGSMASRARRSDAGSMASAVRRSDAGSMASAVRRSDAGSMASAVRRSGAGSMASRARRSDAGSMASRARRSDAGSMASRARRSDAGSMALEVVLVVPVLMLLALFVLWAGRGGRAALITDLAAEEAATAAALSCNDDSDVEIAACEDLVDDVLSVRPGLNFLCIGGVRADRPEGLVDHQSFPFLEAGSEATGVELAGVRFLCETDGAVAPLRGAFPTVNFWGQATEVAIQQAPPRAKLSDASATEGDVLEFTLELDTPNPVPGVLVWTYSIIRNVTDYTSHGVCSDGHDYSPTGTFNIAQGDREATIRIPTCDDALHEDSETFELQLGPVPTDSVTNIPYFTIDDASPPPCEPETPDGGDTDNCAVGTIEDNDPAPTITVTVEPNLTDTGGSVIENSGDDLVFALTIGAPIGRELTFTYGTRSDPANVGEANPGTACPVAPAINDENTTSAGPIDYVAIAPATVTFLPGPTLSGTVPVEVCPDLIGEPAEETLELYAQLVPGAPLEPREVATGVIRDDEPVLEISDARACEKPSSGTDPDPCGDPDLSADGKIHFTVKRVHEGNPPLHPPVAFDWVVLPNDPGAAHGGVSGVTDPCNSGVDFDNVPMSPSDSYYDYLPKSGSESMPMGATYSTATISVTLYDDDLDETDETFRLLLCNWFPVAYVDDPWAVGTIVDDDPPPFVTVADAAATEPVDLNDLTTPGLSFTAELESPVAGAPGHSGREVKIDYYFDRAGCYTGIPPDDLLPPALTAIPDEDFLAGSCVRPWQQVTLPAATSSADPDASVDITVLVLHDLLDEGPDGLCEPNGLDADPLIDSCDSDNAETVALRLVPAGGTAAFANISHSPPDPRSDPPHRCDPHTPASPEDDDDCALGFITDNDGPPAVSIFGPVDSSGDPVAVAEGGDVGFEVVLVDPADPGDRTATRPSGVQVTVGFEIVHHDTTTTPDPLHLTASEPDLVEFPDHLRCKDDPTEDEPWDPYVGDPWKGCWTFVRGDVRQPIPVGTFDDLFDELDSETFELRLIHASLDNAVPGVDGTGLIADDDDPPGLVRIDTCRPPPAGVWAASVAVAHACQYEDHADGTVEFTVGLADPGSPSTLMGSGRDVSVRFTTRDHAVGSVVDVAGERAEGGSDYGIVDATPPPDNIISIAAGQHTASFRVAIVDDSIDEKDERFLVDFQADPDNPGVVSFHHTTAVGVIVDDDTVEMSISDTCTDYVEGLVLGVLGDVEPEACGPESGTVTFTVELSQATSQEVTVDYYTTDLSRGDYGAVAPTDYAAHPEDPALRRTLRIPANTTTATIEVDVRDDDVWEHDEVFLLTLADPSGASLPDPVAVGAILDDEAAPVLSVGDASGAEGSPVVFTATLVKPGGTDRARIGRMATAEWSTAGVPGSAEEGATGDYLAAAGTVLGGGAIVFDPSAAIVNDRTEQTVSVETLSDQVVDAGETFELRVGAVTPAGLAPIAGADPCVAESDPGGTALDDCAVGSIIDGSQPVVRIFDAVTTEGGQLSFTVRLVDARNPGQVLPTPSLVTVKYATAAATGTAPAADPPAAAACDVPDLDFDQRYSYDFDYVAASGTVIFVPDDSDETARTEQRVTVDTCDDHHDEPDTETLSLVLSDALNAHLDENTAATGWITDNDEPPVVIVADATPDDPAHHATAGEGDPVAFTVRLVNLNAHDVPAPPSQAVTVPYHTNSTGDLNATPGTREGDTLVPPEADYQQVLADPLNPTTVRFEEGETQKQVEITTFTDARVEFFERFQFWLDKSGDVVRQNFAGIGAISDACIDPAAWQVGDSEVTIGVNDVTVTEGTGEAEIAVELTAAVCDDVQVLLTHRDDPDETAARAHDYVFAESVLTIAAGDVAPAVQPTVTIAQDAIDEHDEWFKVAADWDPDAAVPDEWRGDIVAQVTIEDDDDEPAVSIFDADPVDAGDTLEFQVRLVDGSGVAVLSGKDVTVDLYTCCGTATPGIQSEESADYYGLYDEDGDIRYTMTFPAGLFSQQNFTVNTYGPADDDEGTEDFHVHLEAPGDVGVDMNAFLGDSSAHGVIGSDCVQGGGIVDFAGNAFDPRNPDSFLLLEDNISPDDAPRVVVTNSVPRPEAFGMESLPRDVLAVIAAEGSADVVAVRFEPRLCPNSSWGLAFSDDLNIDEPGTAAVDVDYESNNAFIRGLVDGDGNLENVWDLRDPQRSYATRGRTLFIPLNAIDDNVDRELVKFTAFNLVWNLPSNWSNDVRTRIYAMYVDDDPLIVSVDDGVAREGEHVELDVIVSPTARTVHYSLRPQELIEGDNIAREGPLDTTCDDVLPLHNSTPDYLHRVTSRSGLWEDGDRHSARIRTCTDSTVEPPETFLARLELVAPTPAAPWGRFVDEVRIEGGGVGVGTIVDSECFRPLDRPDHEDPVSKPTLTAHDVTVAEGQRATMRLTLSPLPFCDPTTVLVEVLDASYSLGSQTAWYSVEGLSADGDDYTGPHGADVEPLDIGTGFELVWPEGVLEHSIEFGTNHDALDEGDEAFDVYINFCIVHISGSGQICVTTGGDTRFWHVSYSDRPKFATDKATVTIEDRGCVTPADEPDDPVEPTASRRVWSEAEADREDEIVWTLDRRLCTDAYVAYGTWDATTAGRGLTAHRDSDFTSDASPPDYHRVPAGVTTVRVPVVVLADDEPEGVETFEGWIRWADDVPDDWIYDEGVTRRWSEQHSITDSDCLNLLDKPPSDPDNPFHPTLTAEDVTVYEAQTATVEFRLDPLPFCDDTTVLVTVVDATRGWGDASAHHGHELDFTGPEGAVARGISGVFELMWPEDELENSIDFETNLDGLSEREEDFEVYINFCRIHIGQSESICTVGLWHSDYVTKFPDDKAIVTILDGCVTPADDPDDPVGFTDRAPDEWPESAGDVAVVWRLDRTLCTDAHVAYGTWDDTAGGRGLTARRGSDFTSDASPPDGFVVPAGSSVVSVPVGIVDDSEGEAAETFRSWIRWTGDDVPAGWLATEGVTNRWTADHRIVDDDCFSPLDPPATSGRHKPRFDTDDVTVTEGETATVLFTLGPLPFCEDTTVLVRVVDDTADHESDYSEIYGFHELLWPGGQLDNSVQFATSSGDSDEEDETFDVYINFCVIHVNVVDGRPERVLCHYADDNGEYVQPWHGRYSDGRNFADAKATVTIHDPGCVTPADRPDDPVGMTATGGSWSENDGAVAFEWTLDRPLCVDAHVAYGTVDGTAERGHDFTSPAMPPGGLLVEAGVTEVSVPITIIDDDAVESVETFQSRIRWTGSAPAGWKLEGTGTDTKARWWTVEHRIFDDGCISRLLEPPLDPDDKPRLTAGTAGGITVLESQTATVPMTLGPLPFCEDTAVVVRVRNVTARHGQDYRGLHGIHGGFQEFTWPGDDLDASLEFEAVSDRPDGRDETFEVDLNFCRVELVGGTAPNNCWDGGVATWHTGYADLDDFPDSVATVTIEDRDCIDNSDDSAEMVEWTATSGLWTEHDFRVDGIVDGFEWTLAQPLCHNARVRYDTVDGTAVRDTGAGGDFRSPNIEIPRYVSLPAGSRTIEIPVRLLDDAEQEGIESFESRIIWVSGVPDDWMVGQYGVSRSWTATHRIVDDDCVSVAPGARQYDRRLPERTLVSRWSSDDGEGDWGPDTDVDEGQTAQVQLTLDPPLCEAVTVEQDLDHRGTTMWDFNADASLFWRGGTTRPLPLPAGQAELTSDFEIAADDRYTDPELDELYDVNVEWGDWADPLCGASPGFCDTLTTTHTIRRACVSATERDSVALTIDSRADIRENWYGYQVTLETDRAFCDQVQVEFRARIRDGEHTATADDVDTTTTRTLDLGAGDQVSRFTVQNNRAEAASIQNDDLDEDDETFELQARLTWDGAPDDRPWTEMTVTIVDDDYSHRPYVRVLDAGRVEPGTTLGFSVLFTDYFGAPRSSGKQLSVRYGFGGSTAVGGADCATAGVDFVVPSDRVLVFEPGETAQSVELDTCADAEPPPEPLEPPERVILAVDRQSTDDALFADWIGAGVIAGEETVTISDGLFVEWAERLQVQHQNEPFAVRVPALDEDVTVDWATEDCPSTDAACVSAATAGLDYQAAEGTLTFEFDLQRWGAATRWISVAVVDDGLNQEDAEEQFYVRLSNPSGDARLDREVGVGTVKGFGITPCIAFESGDRHTLAEGTTLTVYVTLAAPASQAVTADWGTVQIRDDTVAGDDYVEGSGEVEFTAGQTRASFTITALADTEDEQDEWFAVYLANPVGARWCNRSLTEYAPEGGTATLVAIEDVRVGNTAGTGLPVITGTVEVGDLLEANFDSISDADGLASGQLFSYQWQRGEGDGYVNIGRAGSSRGGHSVGSVYRLGPVYRLTEDDEGKYIRIRVGYTDARGHAEVLFSEPVGPVAPDPSSPGSEPLTVEFVGVPNSHDDGEPFTFEVRFSESPVMTDAWFNGVQGPQLQHALEVTYGAVERVSQLGSDNRRWEVEIDPQPHNNYIVQSYPPVTVRLPRTPDCSTSPATAICKLDDEGILRPLYNTATAIVAGPPVTISFRAPDTHDGLHRFSLILDQSEYITRGAPMDLFSLEGGSYYLSWPLSRVSWRIEIQPEEEGKDFKISTRRISQCFWGVCTPDWRPVSNFPEAIVRYDPPPFRAYFEDVPDDYDEQDEDFLFRLRLSPIVELADGTKIIEALEVEGATLTVASRNTDLATWAIKVTPDSDAPPVTVRLPATTDCAATGSPAPVCSVHGRMLSSHNEFTLEAIGPLRAEFKGLPERRGFLEDGITEDSDIEFVLEFNRHVWVPNNETFTFSRAFEVHGGYLLSASVIADAAAIADGSAVGITDLSVDENGEFNIEGYLALRFNIVIRADRAADVTFTLPADLPCIYVYVLGEGPVYPICDHNTGTGVWTPLPLTNSATATVLAPWDQSDRPTVDIDSSSATVVQGDFPVTFKFSEPVTGFELEDIQVVNGTASGFEEFDGGEDYSATIEPAADGTVVLRVPTLAAYATTGGAPNLSSSPFVRTRAEGSSVALVGIDTWNRSGVLTAYRAEFSRREPAMGWTGDVGTCDAGTTDQDFRDSVVQRVNWYRRMAGVPTVAEDPQLSSNAQAKALMLVAEQYVSHYFTDNAPDDGEPFECYTPIGFTGENIGIHVAGAEVVNSYIRERGERNKPVGHRAHLLNPYVDRIGTGDIYAPDVERREGRGHFTTVNVMHVDTNIAMDVTVREVRGFEAWPAPGYAPADTVWGRWSFSMRYVASHTNDNGDTVRIVEEPDFSSATVAVSDDDGPVPIEVIHRGGPLVWAMRGDVNSGRHWRPASDYCYTVTISGVIVDGTVEDPYEYMVCVIDPDA